MKKIFRLLILLTCIIAGSLFVGCNKKYSEEISFFNYGENIDEETILKEVSLENVKFDLMYQKALDLVTANKEEK